ncbi:hypothetical protein A2Y99_03240 [Candidatus Gottesmanbacteria bacterium RBG_13_37_7]|uniref:Uncharacterized protein n=1 Tax=Candidatus Gottesmanbacteria bacterium RBG_13_37_7 TaxID=1798369 RepID=A0A1F5YJ65_9BACT|nr:MAG: hypothetical protein A2Y99_03240 [Candidatus Gottesmanbacteria bacterium RBG_13_37_7]
MSLKFFLSYNYIMSEYSGPVLLKPERRRLFTLQGRTTSISNIGGNLKIFTSTCPDVRVPIPVSWNSIEDYEAIGHIPKVFFLNAANKELQVVEVGPGLGEFLPDCADFSRVQPIAIDPFDYLEAHNLLKEVLLRYAISDRDRQLVITLLERIDRYTDQKKIKLINTTLELAMRDHPELTGIADIVIDSAGAKLYSSHNAKILEQALLRKKE